MRLLKLLALLMAVTAVVAAAAQAGPPWGPATPNFNLEVILRPVAGGPNGAFGLVRFRQPKDADKIVYLDAWVRDLSPNQSYYLQRATDVNVNDDVRWSDMPTSGFSTGVYDTTMTAYEPVRQFGPNSITARIVVKP